MDAEKQKADSGVDHQEKTQVFHAAESRVSVTLAGFVVKHFHWRQKTCFRYNF